MGSRHGPGRRRAWRDYLDRRPEPAVPGPGRAQHRGRQAAGHVRRRRMAGPHAQVRPAADGALLPAGRRGAATAHRRDDEPRVPATAPLHPSRTARTPPRRIQRAARADRQPGRRHAARRRQEPRRARPRVTGRGLRGDRRHPAHGDLRLHGQGLWAADRGTPAEPFGAADREPGHAARRRPWRRPRRPVGPVPGRERGGAAVRGRRRAAAQAGGRGRVTAIRSG